MNHEGKSNSSHIKKNIKPQKQKNLADFPEPNISICKNFGSTYVRNQRFFFPLLLTCVVFTVYKSNLIYHNVAVLEDTCKHQP